MKNTLCIIFLFTLIPSFLNAETEYKLGPYPHTTYVECYTAEQIKEKDKVEMDTRNVAVSIAANVGVVCLGEVIQGKKNLSGKNVQKCIRNEFEKYGWEYISADQIRRIGK